MSISGEWRDRTQAESYSLEVMDDRIQITSPTWRGVLYGIYFLEQILAERGIPALPNHYRVQRRPRFDVRMFGEVYGTFTVSGLTINRPVTRDTFSALSRFGANATFTFVQLCDYLGPGVYPELANPKREQNLAELARLARLARAAGLDLYLDAYNPKLPADHPLFKAHPNAMGATQHGGNIRCLCPSDPATLKFIADGWAEIFRQVPELGGIVAIIGGEGFYHCYMRSDPKVFDCPRCGKRSPEEVVADLTNTVFHAIRKVKPDAEFLAWPYSAFIWSKDPFQLGLVSRLDPGIQIVPEIDKDYRYSKKGYVKNIWDYSIDFLGPSDRYRAISEAARMRGLKVACKTETAVSLEFNGVPYIPCLQRWGKRMDAILQQKPDSIYYAYDITGFARSRPEELAGRLSWEPSGTASEEIAKIAARDFGPRAGDRIIEAWNYFSEAMGHCPHLTHGYYRGPSFIGPGQPLMLSEENMPPEFFGRFFYLAENDLSGGASQASALRPIYTSDIMISPAEMRDMDEAVVLWEKGVKALESAEGRISGQYEREFRGELDLARYFQSMFRSTAAANHFFTLRKEYRLLTQDPSAAGRNKSLVIGTLKKMLEIAKSDLLNARAALPITQQDPRLDLAVRLDLDYRPLAEIIRAKIRYQQYVIDEQIPRAMLRRP